MNRIPTQERDFDLHAKIEAFNPASSVKDRLALAIILDAEQRGTLKPGQTVIEATSGNTGIALAMVCAAKGYPFVAVMSDSFSIERRKLMRAFGAKVHSPRYAAANGRGSGKVKKAEALAKQHGWFLAQQFENPANPAYHRSTTGPEILQDFAGQRLDYFVTGWGTGGTLTGVGEVLKLARPGIKVIASEPAGAALLSGQEWKPHKIQGWTPDFVPAVLNKSVVDEIVPVDDILARDTAQRLAREEGMLAGISSGANLGGGAQGSRENPRGLGDAGHAAGHGGALSLHYPLREHHRRLR